MTGPDDHPPLAATQSPSSGAEVKLWLVESKLPPDVRENIDKLARAEDVQHVAIMPDVHLGRVVNNGSVAATRHRIYPPAIGSDIGCGLSALAWESSAELLKDRKHGQTVLRELYEAVPARKQHEPRPMPATLANASLSDPWLSKQSERDGCYQLGTLGSGNHFVEFQQDDAGVLWLMVHSGSRGMGQFIAAFHQARAGRAGADLWSLDIASAPGRAYWNDMEWAVAYARLNRLAIIKAIVEMMDRQFHVSPKEPSYLDSPHNFGARESHGGVELLVHRKSANAAPAGRLGLIAGSMGSPSYIVVGLGDPQSLCSSSHGAGRSYSRTEARRRISTRELRRQISHVQCDERQLASLREEAPAAYRDLRVVMKAQRALVRQEARLSPLLNFKYA